MSLPIGTVTKRSSVALQRKLARNQQSELIDFNLKFFEKIKDNNNNQDIFIKKNEIRVNAVSGFSKFKFKGEAHNRQKKVDKNTKKFLIHSSSIVGETNGGKSWLIEIPFNKNICLTISKKFIPKIKDIQLSELVNSKNDEILEIFWHLNHNVVFYKLDNSAFSYIGKKKLSYLTSFIKTIHLLAVTGMKWDSEKVSIVKIIENNLIKELKNSDDPDGKNLLTVDDILNQLKENRRINFKAIKRSELKNQEIAGAIKRVSRPPDENDLYRTENDIKPKELEDLDKQLELAERFEAWT